MCGVTTYRHHGRRCRTEGAHRTVRSLAACLWPRALVSGTGPWAVVHVARRADVPDVVHLHADHASACAELVCADTQPGLCHGTCSKEHRLVRVSSNLLNLCHNSSTTTSKGGIR